MSANDVRELDECVDDDDDDVLEPGEVVCAPVSSSASSPADDLLCYRVEDVVGEGRCCLVYSAHAVRGHGQRAAVKCYKRGAQYEGAVKRELHILHLFGEEDRNIVRLFGSFVFKGLHCQIMELLDANVRQVLFRNGRRGLSPWAVQKFARDILTALEALHSSQYTHADLKPANVMWSATDGCFKLLDFGLTFHESEAAGGSGLHQVQTPGYRAPEAEAWNKYKDALRKNRKRKLQGTYRDVAAETENEVAEDPEREVPCAAVDDECPSESSGVFTASEDAPTSSQCTSPTNHVRQTARSATTDDCRLSTSDLSSLCADDEDTPCSAASVRPARHSVIIEEGGEAVASGLTAEWRRGSRRRRGGTRRRHSSSSAAPRAPLTRPGPPSDLWSFGCLLHEVVTGSKLFVHDKLASVLRPTQLVEMRAGATEAQYAERGHQAVFSEVMDLIKRCLSDAPSSRPTAAAALRHHPFLRRTDLRLEPADMTALPTSILQVSPPPQSASEGEADASTRERRTAALLERVRLLASKHGAVASVHANDDRQVLVEFCGPEASENAMRKLKVSLPDFTLFYYPVELWRGSKRTTDLS